MIAIRNAHAFEGAARHYKGEDGYPVGHLMPVVAATDHRGQEYVLPNEFWLEYDEEGFGPYPRTTYDLFKATQIAEKVVARGFINEDHWVPVAEG